MSKILKVVAEGIADKIDSLNNIPKATTIDAQFLFNVAYGIAGLVAVAIIVYSGIIYATSQGDPGKTKKALNTIIYTAVGLVIVVIAAAVTNLLFTILGGAKS